MTLQNQEFIAGLKAKFAEHRIVFWHDPDKRFLEELDNLELENVTLLDMTDQSQLAVKKRIEIDARRFRRHYAEYIRYSTAWPTRAHSTPEGIFQH